MNVNLYHNIYLYFRFRQEELQMLGSDQMVDKTKKKKNLVAKNDTRWYVQ